MDENDKKIITMGVATAAMTAILSNDSLSTSNPETLARVSFSYAEALVAEAIRRGCMNA